MKEKDINIKINGIKFLARACAVIIKNDKVLFQKKVNDKNWALPGGKIRVMETTKETLKRELEEELKIKDVEIGNLISITENFFEFKGEKVHQYIFTHKVDLKGSKYNYLIDFKGVEIEKDLVYKWIDLKEIDNEPIKPDYVVDELKKITDEIKFNTCIE